MAVISHNEIFGRCLVVADRLTIDTKGAFFKIGADKDSLPMAYIVQSYHQNSMIVDNIGEADLIVENYESDDKQHPEAKNTVAYISIFKKDNGELPWL